MLGAERPEPAGGARRRRDRGLRARGVDRLEAGGDEVLADRLLVDLGEQVLDLVVGAPSAIRSRTASGSS